MKIMNVESLSTVKFNEMMTFFRVEQNLVNDRTRFLTDSTEEDVEDLRYLFRDFPLLNKYKHLIINLHPIAKRIQMECTLERRD